MPRLELTRFTNGTYSFLDPASGEPMHSHIGPWEEACSIYARPARLSERVRTDSTPLVVYDVGMGTGANALAAFSQSAGGRPLQVISIEPHLDTLAQTVANPSAFPFIRGWEGAAQALLSQGHWEQGSLSWTLIPSRLEELPARLMPAPEVVFFDMHSPKVVPHLWTSDVFRRFRPASLLITYSASTRVRLALRDAGFQVAIGPGTPAKRETTHASATGELNQPLSPEWFERKLAQR